MLGLVPSIHVAPLRDGRRMTRSIGTSSPRTRRFLDVDARHKAEHDGFGWGEGDS
jgi:hypothetical protein